jgi:hypothetical protein
MSSAPKLRAACFQVLFTSIYHLKGLAIVPFAADLLNLSISTIGGRYSTEVIFIRFINPLAPCFSSCEITYVTLGNSCSAGCSVFIIIILCLVWLVESVSCFAGGPSY